MRATLARLSGSPVWRVARMLLGSALAVGFLVLALRGVDYGRLSNVVRHADVVLLFSALLIGSGNLLLRALRWHILLGPGKPGRWSLTFWVVAVGYLGNSVLPMRAGDFLRSYVLGRRAGMGMGFALATTAVERVIDSAVLVILGTVLVAGHPSIPRWLSGGFRWLGGASAAMLLVLLIAPRAWESVVAWLRSKPSLEGVARMVDRRWIGRFVEGLESIRDARRMVLFTILTGIIWSADAFATTLVGKALDAPLNMAAGFVLLAALGISSSVPITPGQLGVYQLVAATVVESYGIPKEPAVAFAFGLQAINYVLLAFWGVLGVIRLGGRELWQAVRNPISVLESPEPPSGKTRPAGS